MERAKVSIEEIDKALHHELTQRLGYDAKDHMMRVNYMAVDASRTGLRTSRPRSALLFLS
jgi:hypothetical protein